MWLKYRDIISGATSGDSPTTTDKTFLKTHLPDDEEDESGAQHQGEHVAEGPKGERHG